MVPASPADLAPSRVTARKYLESGDCPRHSSNVDFRRGRGLRRAVLLRRRAVDAEEVLPRLSSGKEALRWIESGPGRDAEEPPGRVEGMDEDDRASSRR